MLVFELCFFGVLRSFAEFLSIFKYSNMLFFLNILRAEMTWRERDKHLPSNADANMKHTPRKGDVFFDPSPTWTLG